MRIIMIKKRLASGEPCRKCRQTQDMLERRGVWHLVDEVIWAHEDDPDSPGMVLAREHDVASAPFFIVTDGDGTEHVYTSGLALFRERLAGKAAVSPGSRAGESREAREVDVDAAARELAEAEPGDIITWALERFGRDCAIAFSGAEDVALIDMAVKTGLPFSVFCLDTGRLHPETYEFLDRVRVHYGIDIAVMSPDTERLQAFVRKKGLFSFYDDGHAECCGIRKVEPLERALGGYRAWITGQRRDQNPETRAQVPVIQVDPRFRGAGGPLIKLNPLARWTSPQAWSYIRANGVPYNALHERGFVSIGCAPCTRPGLPGQHEREGRWWWEQADSKECGLHSEPTR